MKTQKELGAVYLKIQDLDVKRFTEITKDHSVFEDLSIIEELKDGYKYIENWKPDNKDTVVWICTAVLSHGSQLITLDELEQLLNGAELNEATTTTLGTPWQPKWGEEIEVRDGDIWDTAFYVGLNPKSSTGCIITTDSEGYPITWQNMRPLTKTITREEAEKQLGLKIID